MIILVLPAGCAKEPTYGPGTGGGAGTPASSGTGGSGVDSGQTGGGGRGDFTVPACTAAGATLGKITAANPLVSVGKTVKTSPGVLNGPKLVDGLYPHSGMSVPAAMLPAWVAIQIAPGPERLLLTWADIGWGDYNTVASGGAPAAYTIATSADSTDGQDGTWETVATVTANTVRERAHSFPFTGKSWVKFSITAASNLSAANAGVFLDEIALYDATATGADRPADTWFFMGDSITVNAFRRQFSPGTSFDAIIHAKRPAFTPAIIDGGIGGELSRNGVEHFATWLMLNPDVRNIALLYGTNDSWGDRQAAGTDFQMNMNALVQMAIDAGRVPILARIPYSGQAPTRLPQFNAIIDAISAAKGLPCGPDLYGWFRDNPQEMSSDGVHPSEAGYRSINRLWADAMLALYPAN